MDQFNGKRAHLTCWLTWLMAGAPPTANRMVPVSDRVLNDRLISVPMVSERPPSSTYPGLKKLTAYRF